MSEANLSNLLPVDTDTNLDLNSLIEQLIKEVPESTSPSTPATNSPEEPLPVSSFSEDNLSQNTDWFSVASKLRQQNRDLIKTIVQLEQTLADTQQELQAQIKRTRSAEALLSQQAQEIEQNQEKMESILEELETSQKNLQNRQVIIENLTQNLETSQQQVAQLERKFAQLQEESTDKAEKLLKKESQLGDLQARWERQKRYTAQYKAALDECLSLRASGKAGEGTSTPYIKPKVTEIQPWSSQGEHLSPPPAATNSQPIEENSQILETDKDSSFEVIDTGDSQDVIAGDENIEIPPVNHRPRLISHVIPTKRYHQKVTVDLPGFLRSRNSSS
jgi:myosin heavy subunit